MTAMTAETAPDVPFTPITTNDPARLKAADAYNAAADHFDAPPLGFWARHGSAAAALAKLRHGERVLDVGCGTGSSALPAAEAVGPAGQVVAIDVAAAMLERARAKAAARNLRNATFRLADMAVPGEPEGSFDAVISVFSLFFTAEMEDQVARLWRLLRPGGRLVVTVWGACALEPGASIFAEALRAIDPERPPLARPWERLTDPASLGRLMASATGVEPELVPVGDRQPLSGPDDWWTIVMGSGYRWEADRLALGERLAVRAYCRQRLADAGVEAVETRAIHAVARKPG